MSAALRLTGADDAARKAWDVLGGVADPEIPVLSLVDLGIVRHVAWREGTLEVGLSPTYSGCPATEVIRARAKAALEAAGFDHVRAFDVLSPPWTSDWISEPGRRKLREYGIAPPERSATSVKQLVHGELPAACPRCNSTATERLSEFGSTPCKSLWRCTACLEPFDRFKCI